MNDLEGGLMINKILMKNVASYKAETVLETDKKVNLIYGLNGTGKSTLSGYLYDLEGEQYRECRVEGLGNTDKVLVYNQKFITDNFYETEEIQGIFTLSKKNKEVKKIVDEAKNKLKTLVENQNKIETERKERNGKYQKQLLDFYKEVWKIKTEYSGGDRVLEYCLEGLKGKQETLFNYLLGVPLGDDEINYSVDDLKQEVQELKGDLEKEIMIKKISFMVEEIEKSSLLEKIIVGNKNSSVATLIEKLGNSAWVNEGLQYVHIDNEIAPCPFCQQMTISKELLSQIKGYFDESYQSDIRSIEALWNNYQKRIEEGIAQIEKLRNNRFLVEYAKEIEICLSKIANITAENIHLLSEKVKTPSIVVNLSSLSECEKEINAIIEKANDKIKVYNGKIDNVQESLKAIKNRFWKLMKKQYLSVFTLYEAAKNTYIADEEEYKKNAEQIVKDIHQQQALIAQKQQETVNIDEAVENIKQGLVDIGITDFTIEKYSEDNALYRLRREGSRGNVFKTLSEGEKMVISFLYFIELCKGETTVDSSATGKIVVIDDPISSLSHIYVFNIGRLIHNEFLRTNKYEQIFVLTHSLYFFYELTNTNHKEREETQKLIRLCKNAEGSAFVSMKYEEIQNDYQAYWHIIKDRTQAPALIANCMRNIIEYFFNFVEKLDFPQVFQKPELQDTRFLAFNRYMNRESHSKGQNIFDIKEFDYDSFRDAFKLVFEIEGYPEHYQKMMK